MGNLEIKKPKAGSRYAKIHLGYFGVDSGQVIICDPCYIDSQWNKHSDDEEQAFFANPAVKDKYAGEFSYLGCAEATLSRDYGQLKYPLGHNGAGVVSTTGFGDGRYDVIGLYDTKENRVKEISIKFY